jgi:hypothetical protein
LVHVVPAADAYWTDQPATSTGDVPRFVSSMKSLVYGAPELPPPPYTSVTRRVVEAAEAGGAARVTAAARTRLDAAREATVRRGRGIRADMRRILTPPRPVVENVG